MTFRYVMWSTTYKLENSTNRFLSFFHFKLLPFDKLTCKPPKCHVSVTTSLILYQCLTNSNKIYKSLTCIQQVKSRFPFIEVQKKKHTTSINAFFKKLHRILCFGAWRCYDVEVGTWSKRERPNIWIDSQWLNFSQQSL